MLILCSLYRSPTTRNHLYHRTMSRRRHRLACTKELDIVQLLTLRDIPGAVQSGHTHILRHASWKQKKCEIICWKCFLKKTRNLYMWKCLKIWGMLLYDTFFVCAYVVYKYKTYSHIVWHNKRLCAAQIHHIYIYPKAKRSGFPSFQT